MSWPSDPNHGHMRGMNMNKPPDMDRWMMHRYKAMMHMTWGSNAEILFAGWPGSSSSMYILALIVVFVLAFSVERLSHCRLIKPGTSHLSAGMVETLVHMLRMGLAYLVMLAIMSFNGGVLLVAVAGHSLGFMLFGSRIFKKSSPSQATEKTTDLPPSVC